jgi:hypothetical protein
MDPVIIWNLEFNVPTLLVGNINTSTRPALLGGNDVFFFTPFTAVASGSCNRIHVYVQGGAGHVKAAI